MKSTTNKNKVLIKDIVEKITNHSNYTELVTTLTRRVDYDYKEEMKAGSISGSVYGFNTAKNINFPESSPSNFSVSKPFLGAKSNLPKSSNNKGANDINYIQELMSDKSHHKNSSVMDSMNEFGHSMNTRNNINSFVEPKVHNIKSKREEKDHRSLKQRHRLESTQIHLENIIFDVDRKLYLKSEEYVTYMMRHMKSLKLKVQDSYLVCVIPHVIDSITFLEELKSREVSLISESLMNIKRRVPKSPVEEDNEMGSSKSRIYGKDNDKDDSKVAYDEEDVIILDEKRLQILTSITFRDLFQKKIKVLEMRKKELFNKSIVYMDYDVIKIINTKNKSVLMG